MGNGRWSPADWNSYRSAHIDGKSTTQVFTSNKLVETYDPRLIQVRESRDSADNPVSTPIILAADVTGSMGMIADTLMRDGLNTLAKEIYAKKPVADPHICVMAVGDAECDQAPLQVTQFEADISLADQVRSLWIEKGGGPNQGESYLLPHLFAARKIVTDAWEKRRKKGFLFTFGDEPFLDGVSAAQAKRFLGIDLPASLSAEDCLALASERFEVFHVIIEERARQRHGYDRMVAEWMSLLPQRVLLLSDVSLLAQTVVSAIQITEGARKSTVAASWGGGTDLVVADAVRNLAERQASTGVVRL